MPGAPIEREVRKCAKEFKNFRRLLYNNKLGEVIEVKKPNLLSFIRTALAGV